MKFHLKHIIGIVLLLGVLVFIHSQSSVVKVTGSSELMSFNEKRTLSKYHDLLLEHYDIDYQILIEDKTGDINMFANKAFESKRVGSRSKTGRGILLVIDKAANKVRMEHSTMLEPIFTDAFTSYIERNQMVPFFKNDQVFMGVIATSELIRNRAEEARQGLEFDDNLLLQQASSIGAGATVDAGIGAGQDAAVNPAPHLRFKPQNTPEATLAIYNQAGALGINTLKFTDLNDAVSTQKLKDRVITPAQFANGARIAKKCKSLQLPTRYNAAGDRAVIEYSLKDRQCGPFLLEKSKKDGLWRLTRQAFGFGITYTFQNEWWLDWREHDTTDLWHYDYAFRHYIRGEIDGRYLPKYPALGVMFGKGSNGALLTEVMEGGTMDKAGFKDGDIILSINGFEVKHLHLKPRYPHNMFKKYLLIFEEGEEVEFSLLRAGQLKKKIMKAPPKPGFWSAGNWNIDYNRPNEDDYFIYHLDKNSPLRAAGFMENDKLVKWNGEEFDGMNIFKDYPFETGQKHTLTIARRTPSGTKELDISFTVPKQLEGYDDPHWLGEGKR